MDLPVDEDDYIELDKVSDVSHDKNAVRYLQKIIREHYIRSHPSRTLPNIAFFKEIKGKAEALKRWNTEHPTRAGKLSAFSKFLERNKADEMASFRTKAYGPETHREYFFQLVTEWMNPHKKPTL